MTMTDTLVALVFTVVLAAAIVLLLSHLMPLADLMMPPALSGAPRWRS